jgi:hypothetical protein
MSKYLLRPGLAAVAVVLLACGGKQGSSSLLRPQLAGRWTFNEAESQSPEAAQREAAAQGRGRVGGIGIGRGGMGGGRGSLPESAEKLEAVRRVTESLRTAGSALNIMQNESSVAIAYADATTQAFPTDGSQARVVWEGVGEVDAKARWRENSLVVERKLEDGITVVETYTRAPESPRLIVGTEVKGTLRTLKFLRVYDGAAPQ